MIIDLWQKQRLPIILKQMGTDRYGWLRIICRTCKSLPAENQSLLYPICEEKKRLRTRQVCKKQFLFSIRIDITDWVLYFTKKTPRFSRKGVPPLHKATADKGEENIPKPTFRLFSREKRFFPSPQDNIPLSGTERN